MARNKPGWKKSAQNSRPFALNWALREARQQRRRTVLAMLLIGFPLMIAAFVTVLLPSSISTTQDHLTGQLGPQAECRVEQLIAGAGSSAEIAVAEQQVREVLGETSQSHSYLSVENLNVTGLPEPVYSLLQVDFTDEVLAQWLPLLEGAAPTQPGQAVVGADLAKDLGKGVGEQFELRIAESTHTLTISGIAKYRPNDWTTNLAAVVSPLSIPPALHAALSQQEIRFIQLVVMDRPADLDDVVALSTDSGSPTCRTVEEEFAASASAADSSTMTILGVVGAVVIVEIILLVGPAFLVGARQNARQLAIVAANGGTPATLRRLTLLRNAVLGLLSGIVGVGAGLLIAVGTYLYTDLTDRRAFIALRVNWGILAVLVLLGVLVSVAASWLPAREASRIQTVQALRGHRAQTRARRSLWILGVALIVFGTGIGLYGTQSQSSGLMLLGIIGVLFGLVASSGVIVQLLGGLARFAGFSLRFALRDAARNRTRTAGAVAAIIAASSVIIAWSAFDNSSEVRNEQIYRLPAAEGYGVVGSVIDISGNISAEEQDAQLRALKPRLEADLNRYFNDVELVEIYGTVSGAHQSIYPAPTPENSCLGGEVFNYDDIAKDPQRFRDDPRCAHLYSERIEMHLADGWTVADGPLVDDGTLFSRLNSAYGSDEIAQVLSAGKSVVTNPFLVDAEGLIHFEILKDEAVEVRSIPGSFAEGFTGHAWDLVLHPAALPELGLTPMLVGYLVVNSGPTDQEVDKAVASLFDEWQATELHLPFHIFTARQGTSPAVFVFLTAALILLVLGVSSISVSLALTDARADLATLGAVGARPQVRRRIAAAYGVIIAGTGSLLGAVGGLVGAAVFVNARRYQHPLPDDSWQLIVDWPLFALVVLGAPAVVVAMMWLFGGGKLPAARRIE